MPHPCRLLHAWRPHLFARPLMRLVPGTLRAQALERLPSRRSPAMADAHDRHYRSEQQPRSPLRPHQQPQHVPTPHMRQQPAPPRPAHPLTDPSAQQRQPGSCSGVSGPAQAPAAAGDLHGGDLGPLEAQMSIHLAHNRSVTQRLHPNSGGAEAPAPSPGAPGAVGQPDPQAQHEGSHLPPSSAAEAPHAPVQLSQRKVPALALDKLKAPPHPPSAPQGQGPPQKSPRAEQGISSRVYDGPGFQQPTQASLSRASPHLQQQSPRARSLSPRAPSGRQLARSQSLGSNRGSPRGQPGGPAQAPVRSPLGLSGSSSLSRVRPGHRGAPGQGAWCRVKVHDRARMASLLYPKYRAQPGLAFRAMPLPAGCSQNKGASRCTNKLTNEFELVQCETGFACTPHCRWAACMRFATFMHGAWFAQAAILDRAMADLQAPQHGAEAVWADPVKVGAIQHALKRPSSGQEFKQVCLDGRPAGQGRSSPGTVKATAACCHAAHDAGSRSAHSLPMVCHAAASHDSRARAGPCKLGDARYNASCMLTSPCTACLDQPDGGRPSTSAHHGPW